MGDIRNPTDPPAPADPPAAVGTAPATQAAGFRPSRRAFLAAGAGLAGTLLAGNIAGLAPGYGAVEEVLPKHITPQTLKAVRAGLDFLSKSQNPDGSWQGDQGGRNYPVAVTSLAGTALLCNGNTPSRGRYAANVEKTVNFLVNCSTANGLITSGTQDAGQPMHGHGFALMFLACVYGTEIKAAQRERTKKVIEKAIDLTSRGQSPAGGWTYTPGNGDEGSVTVTQVQALRAAHNAGLFVPRGTISEAVNYIEKCSNPDGGICYSLQNGGPSRLPISAAAVATLYNAGQYDAPVANRCLDFVWNKFKTMNQWSTREGHDFYCQLYAAQAFYLAGDEYWDEYFPRARDQLLQLQDKNDASWNGDGIGKAFGTAIALIILQLPYKYLPVYQR